MKVTELSGNVVISELEYFSVAQTFDCGQSFRFKVSTDGSVVRADGIALGRRIAFIQSEDGTLTISPCTLAEFNALWSHYLALDTDYAAIRGELSLLRPDDEILTSAMNEGNGIRILRQDPWEALCTFIISQNNNIPRITGLVDALCRAAGEPLGSEGDFAFPTPEAVKKLGVDGLFALKTGFRASYLFDAASRVCSGELDLHSIRLLSTEDAEKALRTVRGVGPKVAACSLLFGFEKNDAFPIDVWVKRVMAEFYPQGVEPKEFGRYAGLAQQYLFFFRRWKYEG